MERINFLLMVVLAIKYAAASNLPSLTFGDTIIITEKTENHEDYAEEMESHASNIKKLTGLQYDDTDYPNFEDRVGEDVGDENNCYSTTKTETPYLLIKGDKSKTVLQTKNFRQNITYTTCVHNEEDNPCFKDVTLPPNTKARCVELKAPISIYVFNPSNNKPTLEEINVPVGCACKFKNIN